MFNVELTPISIILTLIEWQRKEKDDSDKFVYTVHFVFFKRQHAVFRLFKITYKKNKKMFFNFLDIIV